MSTRTSVMADHVRFDSIARRLSTNYGTDIRIERTGDDLFIAWTPDGRVGPYPAHEFSRVLTGIGMSAHCGPDYTGRAA